MDGLDFGRELKLDVLNVWCANMLGKYHTPYIYLEIGRITFG